MAKTNETESMLRMIMNNLSTFKQEMLKRFDEIEKRFLDVDKRFDSLDKKFTKRLDSIGKQLSYLEDDAPTREEFDALGRRVNKLEQKTSSL